MSIPASAEQLLEAIQSVVGPTSAAHPLVLHEPSFEDTSAWDYVKDCLDTGWVSTTGQWVRRFEDSLCNYTGAAQAIAVTNGTVALRLALHLVGVKPCDEVVMPPLSFVATANAVAHLGASPHFVDIESVTLGMDPHALDHRLEQIGQRSDAGIFNRETGRRIAAVLPVHVFGLPAQIEDLRHVADAWGLPLVEDAAEALGSWYNKTHCGLFGAIGTLSFNGNKLLTTGGGGALLTNDYELAKRARHLSTTAKLIHPWEFQHDDVGWNDRMPNLNAALGVAQLENIQPKLDAKRKLALAYQQAFTNFVDVGILWDQPFTVSNFWLASLRFNTLNVLDALLQRNELLFHSHQHGCLLRPAWTLLSELPMYSNSPAGHLGTAIDQVKRIVNLPSSPQLLQS